MDESTTGSFSKEDHRIALSKPKRYVLFIAVVALRSFIVINMSALSASIDSIKASLDITNQQFSQFGTFFNTGRILSSIAFVSLINVLNRKYMLILALTIHCICLILFANITSYFVLLGLRCINGFCILFCFVYFPIWVDQFGIQKHKSLMMTILTLASAAGLIWGYLLKLLLHPSQWRLIFLIEASIVAFFAVFFACFSSNYYDKSLFFSKHEQQSNVTGIPRDDMGMVSIFNMNEQKFVESKPNKDQKTQPQQQHTFASSDSSNDNPRLCTTKFVLLNMAKSVYFFIGGGIQFWFTNYLQTSLNVNDPKQIVLSYTLIWILGPCLGQIIGGSICSYIGGYESKNALLVSFILLLISTPFALIVPFMNNIKYYTFFFGCYTLWENSSGIITNVLVLVFVPKEMRGKANGFFSLIVNVFGLLPSAYLYELLNKSFSHLSSKAGHFCVMYYSLVGVSLLFMTVITQFKERQKEQRKTNREPGEEKLIGIKSSQAQTQGFK